MSPEPPDIDPPDIQVASPQQQRVALELALRPLAPEARGPLLDSIGKADPEKLGPLEALFVAERGGRVVAATWAQPSPGKAAALWPPEWDDACVSDSKTSLALVQAAAAACDAAGVTMTQALFEVPDDSRLGVLQAAGFYKIAELRYLGRSVPVTAESAMSDSGLQFARVTSSDHARLKRLLKLTYQGSLDCPGLDDLRDLDDVLMGYRSTGRYDPAHWQILHADAGDLGVLLMGEHPDSDQAELIYMGLTPEARGRGLGRVLINEALAVAGRMGVEHLMVAVDQQNAPARRLYEAAGFAAWARRHVYVRAAGGRQPIDR